GVDQNIVKAWKVTASANLYSNTIFEHEGQIMFPVEQSYIIAKRTDMPVYLKMTNQLTTRNDFIFELTAQYFSEKNIGQGKELSRGGLDFGMKKKFFENKLEINLTASDIFNTMGLRQKIEAEGFNVEYQNFYETQIFLLALKYRF
ncbi:MAG TPA: outer membrane beta-barrel protein, partial [Bacteroidales bacterium]|nr:outer membrane beta-barrel protein [Bacteroidales bacterium]